MIETSSRTHDGFVNPAESYLNNGDYFIAPVTDHSARFDSDQESKSEFTSIEGVGVTFSARTRFLSGLPPIGKQNKRPNQIEEFLALSFR